MGFFWHFGLLILVKFWCQHNRLLAGLLRRLLTGLWGILAHYGYRSKSGANTCPPSLAKYIKLLLRFCCKPHTKVVSSNRLLMLVLPPEPMDQSFVSLIIDPQLEPLNIIIFFNGRLLESALMFPFELRITCKTIICQTGTTENTVNRLKADGLCLIWQKVDASQTNKNNISPI